TNGFYVPALYTHILKSLYNRFKHLKNCKVQLFEFQKPKMTFHAKGLWLEDGSSWSTSSYYSTMIGSTDYGLH
uniref:CDP-diacylglycerol--glycerol-3-phosphate 3-phosphatidyltransferase n=1 Tax=Romanomermis culicivorax TaxID=13658 RepID=A0A915IMD7_ROMCU